MKELYITGGECLKEKLGKENAISFNEALCDGELSYPLFTDSFNEVRAKEHGVEVDEYLEISVDPLKEISNATSLILVFGKDMFCMCNVVGLLAYLEQINYPGDILLQIVDEESMAIKDTYSIKLGAYINMYKQVLINHLPYEGKTIFEIECGLDTYLMYLDENNEIYEYIRENVTNINLVDNMLIRYTDYGLGDVQYYKMIAKVISGK